MCDYSLHAERTRPAKVGDKLTTHRFAGGTKGLLSVDVNEYGAQPYAVCLLPGTEVAFAKPIRVRRFLGFITAGGRTLAHRVARFCKVKENPPDYVHRDALELPDGSVINLQELVEGQEVTVLQLPAVYEPGSVEGNLQAIRDEIHEAAL